MTAWAGMAARLAAETWDGAFWLTGIKYNEE